MFNGLTSPLVETVHNLVPTTLPKFHHLILMYLSPYISRKTSIRTLVQQTLEFEGAPDVDEAPTTAIYKSPYICKSK